MPKSIIKRKSTQAQLTVKKQATMARQLIAQYKTLKDQEKLTASQLKVLNAKLQEFFGAAKTEPDENDNPAIIVPSGKIVQITPKDTLLDETKMEELLPEEILEQCREYSYNRAIVAALIEAGTIEPTIGNKIIKEKPKKPYLRVYPQ